MTNGDRIRQMSDAELAILISDIADTCEINTECHQSCNGCDEYYCYFDDCLNWIRKEYSDE